MNKHFELELPGGYVEAKTVDAKDTKTIIWLNIVNLILVAAIIAIGIIVHGELSLSEAPSLWMPVLLIVVMLAYIVLHEITHGIVYKLFTKRKLTFGTNGVAAWCGFKEKTYVYRTASLCALLAPFVLFSIVFLALCVVFWNNIWLYLFALLNFAIHIGGCVGDLYDTILYLFKFKDSDVLMLDDGAKQIFYVNTNK